MGEQQNGVIQNQLIHFVTGKLAEPIVRNVVSKLANEIHFAYSIDVLPITVAALMTPKWLLRHIQIPEGTTRLILPGYLADGAQEIEKAVGIPTTCGPKDVRDLPSIFGKKRSIPDDYGRHSISILAEINNAPRMSRSELMKLAVQYKESGADIIDLGMDPGSKCTHVGDVVRELIDGGFTVSIDTFDPWEAQTATRAGAVLVLSVNSANCHASADWGAEVVVVPDQGMDWQNSFTKSIDFLISKDVPFRLDPILEPIGCGFAHSLHRYFRTRQLFPEAPMMMGIGNLTELTDVDSAGVNFLLLGICEELRIESVLTTQVIPWAQSSVRECDIARQMVYFAVSHQSPPKRIDERLIMLRDPKTSRLEADVIAQMASAIKDNNYRILLDEGQIHLVSANVHLIGTDPFDIMEQLLKLPESRNVDPSHAFYLGFEMAKALTALTLGKRYEQDEALSWGMLTRPEKHHRLVRKRRANDPPES
jgi:dihydropteroate synthase-like protein